MIRLCLAVFAASAALALAPGSAATQTRPEMGRLAHSGFKTFSHCTASRLQDGSIVTAAHCLPDVLEDPVYVGLGYDRGDYTQLIAAKGADFQVLPGRDIALLCAQSARQAEEEEEGPALGLPIAPTTSLQPTVRIWGYGRPRVHILNRKSCAVTRTSEALLVLDCAATPGTSGGPVTAGDPPALLGVVSRASRTRTVVERFRETDLAEHCPP